MEIVSITFIASAVAALALYHLNSSLAYRRAILVLINFISLASFAKEWFRLTPILLILLFGYMLMLFAYRNRGNQILSIGIVLFTGLFIYLKKYTLTGFLPALPFPYVVVGMSYIFFRVLHIVIDVSSGAIKEKISIASFFNYTCFCLSFISGPIQRYEDFSKQEREQNIGKYTGQEIFKIFSRIINGYIKIVFISGLLFDLQQSLMARQSNGLLSHIIIYSAAAACYTVYLYMNFSGYVDVVVGTGKLFGFEMPENFNHPFSSKNLIEFWSKWHITLSDWLKLYVFNPLLKFMIQRCKNRKLIPYLGVIAYFVAFLIMGIWHGSTKMFLIYGLFLGFGVSFNKLYELEMRKRLGKKRFSHLEGRPLYQYLGRGFTFGYFSLSLVCIWMDFILFRTFLSALGPIGMICLLAGISVAASVFLFFSDICIQLLNRMKTRFSFFVDSVPAQQLWLSCKLFFLTFVLISNISSVPEFVYKGF